MDERKIHLEIIKLDAFTGDLRWLVEKYIEKGDLRTQEDVDRFEQIVREAKKIDEKGGNEARTHITFQSLEQFGKPFDIYNDPEDRFKRRGVFAGELMKGLMEKDKEETSAK